MNVAQFWDGRAKSLQEQASGPIANPKEMASNHVLALDVLRSIPAYVNEFNQVFGRKQITMQEVTQAIAAFEETLVTPDSRFDQWLKGNKKALNTQELRGYQTFKTAGCVACHNGPAVGGNSFQKMGLVSPYQTSNPAQGRAGVTGKDADRMLFKVPRCVMWPCARLTSTMPVHLRWKRRCPPWASCNWGGSSARRKLAISWPSCIR
jgi:cytochrome c peroxidase